MNFNGSKQGPTTKSHKWLIRKRTQKVYDFLASGRKKMGEMILIIARNFLFLHFSCGTKNMHRRS